MEDIRHRFDALGNIMYGSFAWVFSTIWHCSKGDIERDKNSLNSNSEDVSKNLKRVRNVDRSKGILKFIFSVYLKEFSIIILFNLTYVSLSILNIYYSLQLTSVMDPKNKKTDLNLNAVPSLMIMMVFTDLLSSLNLSHLNLYGMRVNLRIKGVLTAMIFNKMLNSSLRSYTANSTGNISAIIQVDMENIAGLTSAINYLFQGLFILMIIVVINGTVLGSAQSILYVLLIAILLISIGAGALKKKYFLDYMKAKDERVQFLKSLLSGIRMIKYKTLELYYCFVAKSLREREISRLAGVLIWTGVIVCVPLLTIMIIPQLVFLYIEKLQIKSVKKEDMLIFIMYFDIFYKGFSKLNDSLTLIPEIIGSFDRVNTFLQNEEIKTPQLAGNEIDEPGVAFVIQDGLFTWSKTSSISTSTTDDYFKLKIPALKIEKGEFVVVLGANGAGKSSLLYALLNEMKSINSAEVKRTGSVSFVSQDPWVFPDSIKNNIIFGEAFDEERLIESLRLADFLEEVNHMESGIDSYCEENGSNLSGGQRSRLALARCFYRQSDSMIFDDPLKSLDQKVARLILEKSLYMQLKNRTRIMSTNTLSHAIFADRVIIIDKGEIVYNGDFEGIKSNPIFVGDAFSFKMDHHIELYQPEDSDIVPVSTMPKKPEEHRESGRVSLRVFYSVFKEYGSFIGFPIVAILTAITFYLYLKILKRNMQLVDDFGENLKMGQDIGIGITIAIVSLTVLFSAMLLIFYFGKNLSRRLHFGMLLAITHSRIDEFLEIVPSGVILNRLTNDLDFVDRQLPSSIVKLIFPLFGIMLSIVTFFMAIKNSYFTGLLILFLVLVFTSQHYFLKAANNIIRLANTTKSPILQMVASISSGIVEIRAMGNKLGVEELCIASIDDNLKYYSVRLGMMSGYSFYINILNYLLLTIPGFVYIYYTINEELTSLNLVVISLFLKNINMIGASLLGFIAIFNGIEFYMVNMERCKEFEDLEPEPGYRFIKHNRDYSKLTMKRLLNDYRIYRPALIEKGFIKIQNLTVTYPNQIRPVLKNLTFSIQAGEKVAIIGRTGSGKSTLAKVFWRAIQFKEGSVEIDGRDINKLDLCTLRRDINIVSQDISIIHGTLRENLDPLWIHNVSKNQSC